MIMKLKNRRKKIKIRIFILVVLLFLTFFLISKAFNNVSLFLMDYAETEVRKLTTLVINQSIESKSFNKLDQNKLYYITTNLDNEIEMVDYNSIAVNEFLNDITELIQLNLLDLENGDLRLTDKVRKNSGVLFYIPLGTITANPVFNNIGPKIPVKLKVISSLQTNINVRIKEYGINNSFIEMSVYLEVKMRVILPFVSQDIVIDNEIPVSYKLINGKIPMYYGSGGLNKSSNIFSIPLNE